MYVTALQTAVDVEFLPIIPESENRIITLGITNKSTQSTATEADRHLSVALTLFFVPVRFRTLSESETTVSESETAVSAAETTVSAAETIVSAAEMTVSATETTVSTAETPVSAAETTVSAAETTVSAAETTVFRPLKRPFSYFRTRKRYAKQRAPLCWLPGASMAHRRLLRPLELPRFKTHPKPLTF